MPIESVAKLRYVSIPARKMRLVANLIKGMPVEKAINIMNFTRRVAAGHVAQTLKSAAANALSNNGTASLRPEDLYVKEIFVDEAPTAKRLRFQSMGRVFRYKKRFCHLTIKLQEKRPVVAPVAKSSVKAKGATKKAATVESEAKSATKRAPRKAVAKTTTSKTTKSKKSSESAE
ncbi:MAG: 50S ribosomal protein L22 [candidate division Zixibacteria bacterium]|nr:50S ribosomal protein L22 [candidate division Zixibacteria bacterium]